jgi:hypothetical protein
MLNCDVPDAAGADTLVVSGIINKTIVEFGITEAIARYVRR